MRVAEGAAGERTCAAARRVRGAGPGGLPGGGAAGGGTPSPAPAREVVVRGVPLTSCPDPSFLFAFPFVGVGDGEPLPESRSVSREASSP